MTLLKDGSRESNPTYLRLLTSTIALPLSYYRPAGLSRLSLPVCIAILSYSLVPAHSGQ